MLIGLGLVLGMLIVGPAAPALASHGARITIHHRACEPQVQDIFGECHDHPASAPFKVAGVWREPDINGNVSWTPGAGRHVITQLPDAFAKTEGAYVFCSNQVTGAVLWDGPIYDQPSVTITTTAGQAVVCDWYSLFPDLGPQR
jgi:hypothetical protein